MSVKWFKLQLLPDFSLNKYKHIANEHMILEQFSPFLKVLHSVALSYELCIELMHLYYPSENGTKMEFWLGFSGNSEKLSKAPLKEIIDASLISPFFSLHQTQHKPFVKMPYLKGVQVAKREYFRIPHVENIRQKLHIVSLWKTQPHSRLYTLDKLISQLKSPAIFSLSMKPLKNNDSIKELLTKNIKTIKQKQIESQKDLITGQYKQSAPDRGIDETLKSYESWIELLQDELFYQTSIRFWSKKEDFARLLASNACAEVISQGNYVLYGIEEEMSDIPCEKIATVHHVDTPKEERYILPTLFAHSEIEPFFRFPVLFEDESLDMPKESDPVVFGEGVEIGKLRSDDEKGFYLPFGKLTKHTLVAGVPGSGKTNTLMKLAYDVKNEAKVPFLILEPAKREYRSLVNIDSDIVVFAPAKSISTADSFNPLMLKINPFEFPQNFSLEEHINNLITIFIGSFPLFQPLPALVEKALVYVYRHKGWKDGALNRGDLPYPTMTDFVKELQHRVDAANYADEIRSNLKAALAMRFERFVDRELKKVFDTPYSTYKPEEWLSFSTVVELESLGENYANFLTLLLLTLIRETLSVRPSSELKHLLILEEAHNLIGPFSYAPSGEEGDPKVAATAYIVKLLAEVRALGQGIVIADQLPTVLSKEVIKNSSLKICHRLTARDDRDVMGEVMSATPIQLDDVALQNPGEALVSFEGLQKPFFVQVALVDAIEKTHLKTVPDQQLLEMIMQNTANAGYRKGFINRVKNKIALLDDSELVDMVFEEIVYLKEHKIAMRDEIKYLVNLFEKRLESIQKEYEEFLNVS